MSKEKCTDLTTVQTNEELVSKDHNYKNKQMRQLVNNLIAKNIKLHTIKEH